MISLLKLCLLLATNGTCKDFDVVEIEETPNRYRGIWAPWGEWSNVCKCIDKEEIIRSGKRDSLRRRKELFKNQKVLNPVLESQLGQWENWSVCSVSIGRGQQQRKKRMQITWLFTGV